MLESHVSKDYKISVCYRGEEKKACIRKFGYNASHAFLPCADIGENEVHM